MMNRIHKMANKINLDAIAASNFSKPLFGCLFLFIYLFFVPLNNYHKICK